jgi:hypothetical protein
MLLKQSTILKLVELAKKAPSTWMCTSNYVELIKWEHPELDPLDIDIQIQVQEIIDAHSR